ncbi:MAG: formyltransferase family protein [Bacteroidia bacterium]|nr:formyltransferase family protein [Bacteroidia bacterium]
MENTIALFLMTEKGYHVLKNILASFNTQILECVVSSHDRNIDNDYFIEIETLCKENNIRFYDRNCNFNIKSKYSFAISWKWLIKKNDGLIVLHDSLLPKYRGFAPLVNALINNESEIGVTALFANSEYDKGDIIEAMSTSIQYPIKMQEAINQIIPLYSRLLINIINQINNGNVIKTFPQDERKATYSLWRDEDDYFIDWNKDAAFIKRFIDALGSPYKGAKTRIGDAWVRIFEAECIQDVVIENRDAGKVIFTKNNSPVIVCGKGLLMLKVVKDEKGNELLPLKNFRTKFKNY